jgi:hypothetical protein
MMSALGKLAHASWAERGALFRAVVLLIAVRTALVTLPLRTVLRLAERAAARGARPRPAGDSTSARSGAAGADAHLDRMVWAVEVMGARLFPKNPCLTQALVIQVLFRRAGRPAELRIGVRRETDATPQAHAWVESEGAIVIGQSEAVRGYVSLPPLPLDG